MNGIQVAAAPLFDAARAVFYGQFVEAAYGMYDSDPSNATPPPPATLPGNYKFIAWIQMRDFIIAEGDWTFYGLIAQSKTKPAEHVLAIRGTENLTEWWDDLTSMVPVPWGQFGDVAYGFLRIYQTLRVIDYLPPEVLDAKSEAQSLEHAGTFADQVTAAVERHTVLAKPPVEAEAPKPAWSIEVTGHSLGAALATLYVAENTITHKVPTPVICTFASPRVGNSVFKSKFDQLGITSWRIINELDVVPNLPFLGFWHVDKVQPYNSGSSVEWSLGCWHSLNTYLHLLDPKQPVLPQCRWPKRPSAISTLRPGTQGAQVSAAASARDKEIALSVPPGSQGVTINITINVRRAD
jgi:hypothetical protein